MTLKLYKAQKIPKKNTMEYLKLKSKLLQEKNRFNNNFYHPFKNTDSNYKQQIKSINIIPENNEDKKNLENDVIIPENNENITNGNINSSNIIINKKTKLQKINKDVTVGMCSQPYREYQMLRVVEQLLPQCTRICICLNNYKTIPEKLLNNPKIICVLAGDDQEIPDLGCMNKMLFCGDYPGYYATVDDDIDYPPNYIEELKLKVDFYNRKCICSLHGHYYKNVKNGKINFNYRKVYNFYDRYDLDVFCHRVGMGVSMFYPSEIGLKKEIFLSRSKNFGDDEITAIWAQENNIPLVRIATTNLELHEVKEYSLNNGLCKDKNSLKNRKEYLESYTKWKLNVITFNKKICVVSAGTKNLQFQYNLTNENKKNYCSIYGYEFKFIELDTSFKLSYHSRKKILSDIIKSNKYDYVMWIDCDAWFNTFEISLDNVINTFMKDKSLLLSRDHGVINEPKYYHSCYINSGVLLFKCDKDALKIIDLWDNPSEQLKTWMPLYTTLNDQPFLSILCIADSFTREHTVIVDPQYFNTFAKFGFTKSNFILHVPGHKEIEYRDKYSKTFFDLYNKSKQLNEIGFSC